MNKVFFKTVLGAAIALSLGTVVLAQTPTAPNKRAPASVNQLDSDARGFLTDAAEAGHLEIEGSKLALKKSQNVAVKAFAQKMIDDHTKVGQQLEALAKSKGFEPPTEPSLVQAAKLKALDLRDDSFDKAYADEIGVAAHEDAVTFFEKGSKDLKDPDVKRFASEALPSLRHHLQEAKKLQQTATAKTK